MILGANNSEWQRRALIHWYETGGEAKDLHDLAEWWYGLKHSDTGRAAKTFISYTHAAQEDGAGKVRANIGDQVRAIIAEMGNWP